MPGAAYSAESAAILGRAEDIGVYLALWSMRDDSRPDASARRAANDAMDAIDTALRGLHRLRERLVGDIRKSDDAAMARAGALLAELAAPEPCGLCALRAERGIEPPPGGCTCQAARAEQVRAPK